MQENPLNAQEFEIWMKKLKMKKNRRSVILSPDGDKYILYVQQF